MLGCNYNLALETRLLAWLDDCRPIRLATTHLMSQKLAKRPPDTDLSTKLLRLDLIRRARTIRKLTKPRMSINMAENCVT